MNTDIETIHEDRRGRMRLKIVRKPSQYGPRYSTLIYRPFKKEEDNLGKPIWAETHWLDEQDVLSSLRLHQIADDVISDAKRKDSYSEGNEAA